MNILVMGEKVAILSMVGFISATFLLFSVIFYLYMVVTAFSDLGEKAILSDKETLLWISLMIGLGIIIPIVGNGCLVGYGFYIAVIYYFRRNFLLRHKP